MRFKKSNTRQLKVKQKLISTVTFVCLTVLSNFVISGQTASPLSGTTSDNYRIGSGDVIDVVVSKQPILSRTNIRVSNEGVIQLPMLEEDIPAKCMTEKELSVLIAEKYKKYLLNPNVIVSVTQFNSTPVSLIGSVIAPTRFQLQRPTRLQEVLLLGNGPSAQAGPTVQIIRLNTNNCSLNVTANHSSKEELFSFNLKDTLEGKDEANPFVLPGDLVRVIEAEVVRAKVEEAYIIGNVNSAKTISLSEPVTLTQAIAMAGGTSTGAQLDRISISRQITGSLNKTQIIVNLKEIKKKNEGDILLQDNDIIEVPGPSGTKKFLQDIFRTIIPSVTRLPIRVIP